MKKIILFLFLCFSMAGNVQAYDNGIRDNPVLKVSRSYLRNTGDERKARNLLVVKEVADFKIGDEKLSKDFEMVESTDEFERKMAKIMEKLSNKKMRDSKNREVINILNEAGDKLYNLLAN
ncbi:MAG: hypothetical protein IJ778_02275 [Alphaproteobacteria bacterium]|nr:hypothetical protein [Alphaproteobacteria bacterium]